MRIVISAGGSGGHIYPAIALIKKIKKENKSAEIFYIGRLNSVEYNEVKKLKIPFIAIESYYLERKKLLKNWRFIKCFIKNYFFLRKKFKAIKPNVIIGFGGHVTLPVIYTGRKLKIKTIIHEQNKILGGANRFLKKYADVILLSYPNTKETKENQTIVVGNPITDLINDFNVSKKDLGLSEDKKLVLITMGSQGAANINKYLYDNLSNLSLKNYQVLYVTGRRNFEEKLSKEFPKDIMILPYIDNMVKVTKHADLIVSRAGATTLAEIIALKKPAILIPSPFVPDNHQYYNAEELFAKNAALHLKESEIEKLPMLIETLISDNQKRQELANNLADFQIDNSAELIYNVLKSGEN